MANKPTSLTGTIWNFNDTLINETANFLGIADFEANNEMFNGLFVINGPIMTYYYKGSGQIIVHGNGQWDENYKTIKFKSEPSSYEFDEFVNWLLKNATWVNPPSTKGKLTNLLNNKKVAGCKNSSGSPLVKMTNLNTGKYIEFEQTHI